MPKVLGPLRRGGAEICQFTRGQAASLARHQHARCPSRNHSRWRCGKEDLTRNMGGNLTAPERVSLPSHHQALVDRFVNVCSADERIVAAFLGGSNAKGKADEYSDLDLCVITSDASFEEFYNQRESFLRSLGDLVFFENFGNPNVAFYIFADGNEGELNFG